MVVGTLLVSILRGRHTGYIHSQTSMPPVKRSVETKQGVATKHALMAKKQKLAPPGESGGVWSYGYVVDKWIHRKEPETVREPTPVEASILAAIKENVPPILGGFSLAFQDSSDEEAPEVFRLKHLVDVDEWWTAVHEGVVKVNSAQVLEADKKVFPFLVAEGYSEDEDEHDLESQIRALESFMEQADHHCTSRVTVPAWLQQLLIENTIDPFVEVCGNNNETFEDAGDVPMIGECDVGAAYPTLLSAIRGIVPGGTVDPVTMSVYMAIADGDCVHIFGRKWVEEDDYDDEGDEDED